MQITNKIAALRLCVKWVVRMQIPFALPLLQRQGFMDHFMVAPMKWC
jgi:hypothetical protein